MKRLLLTALCLADSITHSSGGLWGRPNRPKSISCRGGSFPPPPDYDHNNNEHGGYPSQEMPPPDLPHYGDGSFYPMNHHPQHQGPPPLPPDYDEVGQNMPPPPGYPDDSLFQGGDEEINNSQQNDSSGMDLSLFDKHYILKGLAKLYKKKILPLELSSRYGHFHSPPLSPSDFVAPPMVLLLGQYR